MKVKVKCNILGKKPGDVVEEGDKFYEDFLAWATKKSTRNGAVICEICETSDNSAEGKASKSPVSVPSQTHENGHGAPVDTGWRGADALKRARMNGRGTKG